MSKQRRPKRTCKACGKVATDHTPARLFRDGKYSVVGYYCKDKHGRKREEDKALARLRREEQDERATEPRATTITCEEYAARYLAWYEAEHKWSSFDTARQQLRRFRRELGDRPLASIRRDQAIEWSQRVPVGEVVRVRAMFARAMDEYEDTLPYRLNPFRALGKQSKGRADIDPPTEEQMILLLDGCSALGDDYAPTMRAMLTFACYSLLRPGELRRLDWRDVDLAADEVRVREREYRGNIDLPKSNEARTVALLPQAKAALLTLPERHGRVFPNMTGGQMSAPTLTAYWKKVRDRAQVDLEWYTCSKHFGVHFMKVKLGLPNHDIAHQAGWSERSVERMVKTYAHTNVGALARIKAAAAPTHEPMHTPTEAAQ